MYPAGVPTTGATSVQVTVEGPPAMEGSPLDGPPRPMASSVRLAYMTRLGLASTRHKLHPVTQPGVTPLEWPTGP